MVSVPLTDAELLCLHPNDILEQILASDARQNQMRRIWLRALMVHSKSSHATSFDLRCDAHTRQLRKSDLVIESSPPHTPCLLEANLLVSAFVEGRASFNRFERLNLCSATPITQSSHQRLQLSAVQDRDFLGCVSLRDSIEATSSVVQELEKAAALKVWEKATCTLLYESHARSDTGPTERQAFLYTDDGGQWMRTLGPEIWASASYVQLMQRRLREFTERGSQEQEYCFQGTSLRFSRVSGKGGSGILAIVAPTLPSKVSTFTLLSPTQRLVCLHIACGFTVGETAHTLKRSEGTVKGHIRKAYESLQIGSQAELALMYEGAFDWFPDS